MSNLAVTLPARIVPQVVPHAPAIQRWTTLDRSFDGRRRLPYHSNSNNFNSSTSQVQHPLGPGTGVVASSSSSHPPSPKNYSWPCPSPLPSGQSFLEDHERSLLEPWGFSSSASPVQFPFHAKTNSLLRSKGSAKASLFDSRHIDEYSDVSMVVDSKDMQDEASQFVSFGDLGGESSVRQTNNGHFTTSDGEDDDDDMDQQYSDGGKDCSNSEVAALDVARFLVDTFENQDVSERRHVSDDTNTLLAQLSLDRPVEVGFKVAQSSSGPLATINPSQTILSHTALALLRQASQTGKKVGLGTDLHVFASDMAEPGSDTMRTFLKHTPLIEQDQIDVSEAAYAIARQLVDWSESLGVDVVDGDSNSDQSASEEERTSGSDADTDGEGDEEMQWVSATDFFSGTEVRGDESAQKSLKARCI